MYSVGADVTADDVVQFYTQQLGDSWQHCDYQIQIAAPENPGPTPAPANGNVTAVNFFRNGAQVGVLTDGLSPVTRANTFEIGIDHDAPKNPCTGEKLR